MRVLKIRHEDLGTGIEGVDDHLAFDRARYFHTAFQQVGRQRRNLPLGFTNLLSLRQEMREFSGIQVGLNSSPAIEQLPASALILAAKHRNEPKCIRCKDFGKLFRHRRVDLNTADLERLCI